MQQPDARNKERYAHLPAVNTLCTAQIFFIFPDMDYDTTARATQDTVQQWTTGLSHNLWDNSQSERGL